MTKAKPRRRPSRKALLRKSKTIDTNLKSLQQQVDDLQYYVKRNETEEENLISALDDVRQLFLEKMPKGEVTVKRQGDSRLASYQRNSCSRVNPACGHAGTTILTF